MFEYLSYNFLGGIDRMLTEILPLRIVLILGFDHVTVAENLLIRRLEGLYGENQFRVCSTMETAQVFIDEKPSFVICVAKKETQQQIKTFFGLPFFFENGISKVLAFDTTKIDSQDESWKIGQGVNFLFDESKQKPGFKLRLQDVFGDPDIPAQSSRMLCSTEFPLDASAMVN